MVSGAGGAGKDGREARRSGNEGSGIVRHPHLEVLNAPESLIRLIECVVKRQTEHVHHK
jgi:hypothetical protein